MIFVTLIVIRKVLFVIHGEYLSKAGQIILSRPDQRWKVPHHILFHVRVNIWLRVICLVLPHETISTHFDGCSEGLLTKVIGRYSDSKIKAKCPGDNLRDA